MRPLSKPLSKTALPFVAALLGIGLFLYIVTKDKEQRYLSQYSAVLETAYRAAVDRYTLAMDTLFNETLQNPKVIHLFAEGARAEGVERDRLRGLLYRTLHQTYRNLVERNVRQFHFHRADGTSFLRFHQPELADDPLMDLRPSIRIANLEKRAVSGFEAGRIISGFRFVRPLAWEGAHVGSVEISLSFKAIRDAMASLDAGREFDFLISRHSIDSTLLESQRSLYRTSDLHPDYWKEDPLKELFPSAPELSEQAKAANAVLRSAPQVQRGMAEGGAFTVTAAVGGGVMAVSFLPVRDVEGKLSAYVIGYSPTAAVSPLWMEFFVQLAVAAAVLTAGFLLVWRLLEQHHRLAKEKLRLDAITQAMAEGLYVLDKDGRSTFVNRATCQITGFEASELVGREIHDLIHNHALNDGLPLADCPIFSTVRSGRAYNGEEVFIGKTGGIFPVEVESRPLIEDGQVRGAVTVFRDITQRQAAERALRASEERYSKVLEVTGGGVWDWDIAADRVSHNAQWCWILGLNDSFLEHPIHEFIERLHEDDRGAVWERVRAALDGAGDYVSEHRMRRLDGSVIWVVDRGTVTSRTASGEPLRMLGSFTDITARKTAEIALREQEARYRSVVTAMTEGIIIQDVAGRVVECNPAARRILGLNEDAPQDPAAIERCWNAMQADGAVGEHPAMLCLRNGQPERGIVMSLPRRGGATWISINAEPLFNESGAVTAVVSSFADITVRQETERELRRSNAELEQFAYVVSHDLRQPLRMISSYSRLLELELGEALSDDARQFIGFVHDGGTRMDEMLVSLLEYSRVGRKGEPMEEVDSRDLIDEALLFLGPSITESHADIRVSGDWPRIVISRNEGVRLFQNLVGNALKYRSAGRPPVIAVQTGGDGGAWTVSVQDNGIGIPAEHFERIFGVFQRLHGRGEYEGTGVGLAICRKIVNRLGGTIGVSSRVGEGSVFTVSLPAEAVVRTNGPSARVLEEA